MTTRRALARALDTLETEAGDVVVRALRSVVRSVVAGLDKPAWPTVVASAEDELGRVLTEWGDVVDTRVLPYFAQTYQAGGLAAVVQLGQAGFELTDAQRIAEYMDEGARDHLAVSRNRFLEVGNRAWEELRSAMVTGFERGDGVDKIARELRRAADLSETTAMMVARTEVVSAANAGASRRVDLAAAIGDEVPGYKQWLSTLDARTRPSHVIADGDVVARDERFQVGSSTLAYPGDPAGAPEEVINCRCTVLFVEDELGEIEGVEGRQEGGVLDELVTASTVVELLARDVELRLAHQDGKHSQKLHGGGGRGGGNPKAGGHTRTGVSLSEMGRRGERLFVENQSKAGVTKKFGKVRETAKTPQGQNPIDIESDSHAIEVKTMDSRAVRLQVNIKSAEVDSKQAAADLAGKDGAVVAQIYDHGTNTMHVFAHTGGFRPSGRTEGRGIFEVTGMRTGRPVAMERLGSYDVPPGAFDAEVTAMAGLGDEDESGDTAEAGDVVIEWEKSGGTWRATLTEMPGDEDEDATAATGVVSSPQADVEAIMPYSIRTGGAGCPFQVYNTDTDEPVDGGCHPTRAAALDHQRALMANEDATARVDRLAGQDPIDDDLGNADALANEDGDAGGKPNQGTTPDKRLKRNRYGKAKTAAADEPDPDDVEHGAEMEVQDGEHFHAIMHTEGNSTGLRTFTNLTWREPPFTFHWQKESSAHGGQPAVVAVGLVSRVVRDHFDESIIHGFGSLDLESDDGRAYGRRLVGEFERWVSIGLDESPFTTTVDWPESEDGEDDDPLGMLFGRPEQIHIDGGRIGELTGVSVPAQDDAVIEATEELREALGGLAGAVAEQNAGSYAAETRAIEAGDIVVRRNNNGVIGEMVVSEQAAQNIRDAADDEEHFASVGDAQVDWGAWDGNAAMAKASSAADYRAICAGRRAGDPELRETWALPHHSAPGADPNAAGVRAALGRFESTQGLTNAAQARAHLDRHQSAITAARERRQAESDVSGADVADVVEALTASAHIISIPDPPPAWWFDPPTDVEIPGALCVTDEGRLYGIVAPLGTGHRAGSRNGGRTRITAPHGNVDYSRFLNKEAIAVDADGNTIRVAGVGAVTMDCGHASRFRPNHQVASEHYDNACSIVAKIAVGEVGNVVWAAGALEPGVTPSQISRMLACALSGDWQPHPDRPGWSELVAALLVPSEGFPVARTGPTVSMSSEGVLVASAVPVMHREPHYIPSIDRDPVLALGLNDVAAAAVRRSYVHQITKETTP